MTSNSEAGQTENQEKKVSDEKEASTDRMIIFYINSFKKIIFLNSIETGYNTGIKLRCFNGPCSRTAKRLSA